MVARPLGSQQPQISHISMLLYILDSIDMRIPTWEDLNHGKAEEKQWAELHMPRITSQ